MKTSKKRFTVTAAVNLFCEQRKRRRHCQSSVDQSSISMTDWRLIRFDRTFNPVQYHIVIQGNADEISRVPSRLSLMSTCVFMELINNPLSGI